MTHKGKCKYLVVFGYIFFSLSIHQEIFAQNKHEEQIKFTDSIAGRIVYTSYTTTINAKENYQLKITTTYLKDTQKSNESYLFDQNNVVTKQILRFYHNDSLLRQIENPSPILLRIFKNTKIKVLDNVIVWGGYIAGKQDFFYDLYAAGGCNTCSEATYFYSKSGAALWSSYLKKGVSRDKGDYYKIIKDYNISDSVVNSRKIPMEYIFPPFNFGKKLTAPFH